MKLEIAEKKLEKLSSSNESMFENNNRFVINELIKYIVQKTNDPEYSFWIGSTFLEYDKCDISLYYFEKAVKKGYTKAYNELGNIYKYGYSSKGIDFKKAFECYMKCPNLVKEDKDDTSYISAQLEMAKMYKKGEYVKKDKEKYKEIVLNCYEIAKEITNWTIRRSTEFEMSKICKDEGNLKKFIKHIDNVIDLQLQLVDEYVFVDDLYELEDYVLYKYDVVKPEGEIEYYDLFYLLKNDCTIMFKYDDEYHTIECYNNDQSLIKVDKKYVYKDVVSFLLNFKVNGNRIIDVIWNVKNWRKI